MNDSTNVVRKVADYATIAVAVCAVLVVGVSLWDRWTASAPSRDTAVRNWEQYGQQGNRIGPARTAVTIVEFGDYECPFCRRLDEVVHKALRAYPQDVAFVYRHYPLTQHLHAYRAARLAECAADQHRFEEVHRLLFEDDSLSSVDARAIVERLDIPDQNRYLICAADTARVPSVEADLRAGAELGVDATPTVLVNGLRLAGTPDSLRLFGAIERAIDRARKSGPARPNGEEASTIALVGEVRIDGNAATLMPLGGAVMLPDRGIAFTQPVDHTIRFFGPDGRPTGYLGRRGAGPGEFEVLSRIGLMADTPWVYDGRLRRFAIFSRTGDAWTFLRTETAPFAIRADRVDGRQVPEQPIVSPEARYADGAVLALLESSDGADRGGYFMVDVDGQIRNVVATYRSPEHDERFSYFHRFPDGSVRGRLFPLAPLPHRQISADGALHALVETTIESRRGGFFNVTLIDTTGDTLYSRRHQFHGVPVPRAEAARLLSDAEARLRQPREGADPRRALEAAAAWRAAARVPPAYPPIVGVLVGSDSTVWLQLRETDTETAYLRIGPTGDLSGRATLPSGSRIVAAGATHLWVTETDALGVPSIRRYRIE